MYDELVKSLRDCAKVNSLSFYKRGLMKKAADAIEKLLSRLQNAINRDSAGKGCKDLCAYLPKWIPVTEQLPEAGERVLCYCRANIYEAMKMRTDGGWVHIDQLYGSTYMGGFVTHWMPLPEPPKEATDG